MNVTYGMDVMPQRLGVDLESDRRSHLISPKCQWLQKV